MRKRGDGEGVEEMVERSEGSFILRFAETNGNKDDLEKNNQKFNNKTK